MQNYQKDHQNKSGTQTHPKRTQIYIIQYTMIKQNVNTGKVFIATKTNKIGKHNNSTNLLRKLKFKFNY